MRDLKDPKAFRTTANSACTQKHSMHSALNKIPTIKFKMFLYILKYARINFLMDLKLLLPHLSVSLVSGKLPFQLGSLLLSQSSRIILKFYELYLCLFLSHSLGLILFHSWAVWLPSVCYPFNMFRQNAKPFILISLEIVKWNFRYEFNSSSDRIGCVAQSQWHFSIFFLGPNEMNQFI